MPFSIVIKPKKDFVNYCKNSFKELIIIETVEGGS